LNEKWQRKPKCLEKPYARAILSTTNPTSPEQGSNGKLVTNGLSYVWSYLIFLQMNSSARKNPDYIEN
jgi:hypothetical protein